MPAIPLLFLNSAALHLPVSVVQTVQQFTVLVLCLSYATECKPEYFLNSGELPAANNITLVLIKWFPPAIKVHWQLNQTNVANVKEMQIFYNPVKSSVRSMIKVSPDVRQVTLNKLQPNQEYELELVSVSHNSMLTNSSNIVNFVSPSNESSPISKFSYYTPYSQEEIRRKLRITMDEIVILIIVLIVWLTVICIFCSKWSKLRHLEPYHPDYRPSGSTAQHSPAYSVDSDNLANVGALTTTPVANSGGLGDLTDEEDDGLLIGNAINVDTLAGMQPILPCSGIHPAGSLFAHSNCAHATNLSTVYPTLGGLFLSDQLASNLDDINEINIPIPSANLTNNNYTPITTTATNKISDEEQQRNVNFVNSSMVTNQVKKQVQFQSVHPHFAQYANNEILQRTNSPATFVLPVSMATPHLNDIYCHGTAIAYNTNYSSIDSTASFNSTSCASCCNQIQANLTNPNQCQSQTESLEHASIYLNNMNTDTDSSSIRQQQSVESIYIELPTKYHVRSNSTPSDEFNLNTIVYNTASSMNKYSPLTEEPFDEEERLKDTTERNQIAINLINKKVKKSKSEEQIIKCTINSRKTKSLELNENIQNIQNIQIKDEKKSKLNAKSSKQYYHSVDNVLMDDLNLQYSISQIPRYHSSNGLFRKKTSSSIVSTDQQISYKPIKHDFLKELLLKKRPHKKRKVNLLRKEHYKSDNLIIKNRHKFKLNELSDEFRSSLTQRNHPFKQLHRSFTESETSSSCFTRTNSTTSHSIESSERCHNHLTDQNKAKFKNPITNRRAEVKGDSNKGRIDKKSRSSIDSTDYENSLILEDQQMIRSGCNKNKLSKQQQHDTIIVQSDDKFRRNDELDLKETNRSSLTGSSIKKGLDCESNQLYDLNQVQANKQEVKMYQSATMYNISSSTELLIGNFNRTPIRRHQSAEQMLKRIVENIYHLYRKQFKS